MIKEQHPFLLDYPLKNGLKYLIIGTIPPNKSCAGRKFILDYFYGNDWTIWSLIQPLYPQFNFKKVDEILRWQKEYLVGFSDTVKQCNRLLPCSPLDRDLNLHSEDYNNDLRTYVMENHDSIEKVFFTSSSGSYNAFSNFKIIMGSDLALLDSSKLIKLPSPAGSSNTSLFKGKAEQFGLVMAFYKYLEVVHPDALIYAEKTWGQKQTLEKGKKLVRLPSDKKYTKEFKAWFYKTELTFDKDI